MIGEQIKSRALGVDLGYLDFEECWAIQHQVHLARTEERLPDSFLIVEHPHVFTVGRNGCKDNILVNAAFLKKRGIDVISIERGGDVTYHGPGQLVVYPIFSLRQNGMRVVEFVSFLEEAMIRTLRDFEINGERSERNRGVWTGTQKIGFVGIAVRKGVTMHGLALNISTDLSYYRMIHSCGLKDVSIGSIESLLNKRVEMEQAKSCIISHIRDIMKMDIEEMSKELFCARLSKVSRLHTVSC